MEVQLFLVKQELQKVFIYVANRSNVFFVTSYYDKKELQSKSDLVKDLYNRFGVKINLFIFNIFRKEIIFCGEESMVNRLKEQLGGEVIVPEKCVHPRGELFFWYSYEEWPPDSIDFIIIL